VSVAQWPSTTTRDSSRWLLLGSLALNLFFIGIAIALAVRPPPASTWNRDVFVRVERLAAALPPADGELLRGQMKANHDAIAKAQDDYHNTRDTIRAALRQEPFEASALQAAMAKVRATRQVYDQTIQGAVAVAAAQMSPAGRHVMADWPPGRKPTSGKP
jgi:uncharacterized membrane protein